jgi:hypothetical protein
LIVRAFITHSGFFSSAESQLVQQSIAKYGQKITKPSPIPPITKNGIQEHLLAIITTCDLVSHFLRTEFMFANLNKKFQPFRFVERPAVRDFITFLNHKVQDDDIPRKSSIANAVKGKVLQLEELTLAVVEVRISCLNLC